MQIYRNTEIQIYRHTYIKLYRYKAIQLYSYTDIQLHSLPNAAQFHAPVTLLLGIEPQYPLGPGAGQDLLKHTMISRPCRESNTA
jgi:hypothetical protein